MKKGYTEITNTIGFEFVINPQLQKGDFIKICEELRERLSTLENRIIKVIPEPIAEGGIQLLFENPTYYKCMRLCVNDWEYLRPDTYDKWTDNTDLVLWTNRNVRNNGIPYPNYIRLKAYHNAPIWTLEEVNVVKEIFQHYNIQVKGLPKKRNLKTYTYNP